MGLLKKLDSSHIVYTLGLWQPECLEFGRLDSGRLVLGQKDASTQKIKICILLSKLQVLAFKKTNTFLLKSGRQGDYNVSKTSH